MHSSRQWQPNSGKRTKDRNLLEDMLGTTLIITCQNQLPKVIDMLPLNLIQEKLTNYCSDQWLVIKGFNFRLKVCHFLVAQ